MLLAADQGAQEARLYPNFDFDYCRINVTGELHIPATPEKSLHRENTNSELQIRYVSREPK
jgi:hypothetical protein